LDQGLQALCDGLNLLDQEETHQFPTQYVATANYSRAQLYSNMAWTLLQEEDKLILASVYSSTALSFAEKIQGQVCDKDYNHLLGRSLRLMVL